MLPTIQKDATAVTNTPLTSFELHSLASVKSGGTVAPMPTPATNRHIVNETNEGANIGSEEHIPATEFVNSPSKRAGLRPIRSDKNPSTVPPISIPTKIDEARYSAPSIEDEESSENISSLNLESASKYDSINISVASDELAIHNASSGRGISQQLRRRRRFRLP
mmetsp:Transcript_22247/g.34141  ORF Transcript_22247/g.34141 Transcript_22247/m.34141 type:complete len:165 (-) Transcript_22247:213-707(-)